MIIPFVEGGGPPGGPTTSLTSGFFISLHSMPTYRFHQYESVDLILVVSKSSLIQMLVFPASRRLDNP